jgi:hypothetical protein
MRFSLVWLQRAPDQAQRLADPYFAPMFLLHLSFFVISVDVTGGERMNRWVVGVASTDCQSGRLARGVARAMRRSDF